MVEVLLTFLSTKSRNKALRTDSVTGVSELLPSVGQPFAMVAEPLGPEAGFRIVKTTKVKEVRHHPEEGSMEFWTENSHYGLQILDFHAEGNA